MDDRPFVIKGKTSNWKCHDWTPENLNHVIKDTLTFRIGKKITDVLQYESNCEYIKASVDDFNKWVCGSCEINIKEKQNVHHDAFLNYSNEHYWGYADYKYMKDLFNKEQFLLDVVDWSSVGLNDRNAKDSTFWLGSKGAYTVCHYDTYGCNLVAQIYGRKRWTLYPPEQSPLLYPTRIPYEESSVFSQVNIANPDFNKHRRYKECTPYAVVLEPGDILYVPRHWWHFVECLDTAISINTWLEMEQDTEERIKEAVTRSVVCALMQDTYEDWLNPTENEYTTEENTVFINSALNESAKKNDDPLEESTKKCGDPSSSKTSQDTKVWKQMTAKFHEFVNKSNTVKHYCKCYNFPEYMEKIRYVADFHEHPNVQCIHETDSLCVKEVVRKKQKLENYQYTEPETHKEPVTNKQNKYMGTEHNVMTDKSFELKDNFKTRKLKTSDIVNCFVDSEVVQLMSKKLLEKHSMV